MPSTSRPLSILMISHYAGAPQYGMEFRSYYMGREWVRQGHKVTIVGASFSHLRKQQPQTSHKVIDGIQYIWLPTQQYEGNGIRRVLTMFEFSHGVRQHQQELLACQPDVVIASSVHNLDIYACHALARKAHARLVLEVHDLWPLSPMIIGGYKPWHPFIQVLQWAENYAYKHCDHVISIPDKTYPHMRRHGLPEYKFACVPNGFLLEEWEQIDTTVQIPQQHQQLFSQLRQQGKTIIGFAGGHTQSTAMEVLVHAANSLRSRHDIAFVLVGQGPQKDDLIALAKQYDLQHFYFLPPVEKRVIPLIIQSFDICYAGGVHSILHQYGTSFNKVTDYMVAARPIIFSVDEPGSLVERVGCGLQVEAENIAQVAAAIVRLADLSPAQRQEMGNLGRSYALTHLNYATLASQFIQFIQSNK